MGSPTRLPCPPAAHSSRSTSRPDQNVVRDVRRAIEPGPRHAPSVRFETDPKRQTPDSRISTLNDRVRDLREKQWNVLAENPVDWARLARLSEAIYEIERRKLSLRRATAARPPADAT